MSTYNIDTITNLVAAIEAKRDVERLNVDRDYAYSRGYEDALNFVLRLLCNDGNVQQL